MITAIVGAGDLGGALASTLATRGRVREIRLIDEASTSAQGKALDIQQSTPVYATATTLSGFATIDAVDAADVVVVADAFGPPSREWQGESGLALLRRLAAHVRAAPFVLAGASHAWLVERACAELGLPWTRVVGSAPAAILAALRGIVGLEAGASPLDVQVGITGLPPHDIVIGWEAGSIAHTPLQRRLDGPACGRIAQRLPFLWPPGPLALASAAASMVEAMMLELHVPHPAFVALAAEGSAARRAVIATAHVASTGISRASLPELSSHERLALENVLGR
jgi:hypothetical protein